VFEADTRTVGVEIQCRGVGVVGVVCVCVCGVCVFGVICVFGVSVVSDVCGVGVIGVGVGVVLCGRSVC